MALYICILTYWKVCHFFGPPCIVYNALYNTRVAKTTSARKSNTNPLRFFLRRELIVISSSDVLDIENNLMDNRNQQNNLLDKNCLQNNIITNVLWSLYRSIWRLLLKQSFYCLPYWQQLVHTHITQNMLQSSSTTLPIYCLQIIPSEYHNCEQKCNTMYRTGVLDSKICLQQSWKKGKWFTPRSWTWAIRNTVRRSWSSFVIIWWTVANNDHINCWHRNISLQSIITRYLLRPRSSNQSTGNKLVIYNMA